MGIIPVFSDISQGEGDMNPSTRSQNVRFRRAFWKNYAEVQPGTPKAERFLTGYGISNPRYRVKKANLSIKQWLGSDTVGISVVGRNNEPPSKVRQRVDPFRKSFDEEFEDVTYNDSNWWFVSSFTCEGGTRNFWIWDEAAAWLEERRKRYEEILSR